VEILIIFYLETRFRLDSRFTNTRIYILITLCYEMRKNTKKREKRYLRLYFYNIYCNYSTMCEDMRRDTKLRVWIIIFTADFIPVIVQITYYVCVKFHAIPSNIFRSNHPCRWIIHVNYKYIDCRSEKTLLLMLYSL